MRTASLAFFLCLFWIVSSGHTEALLLGFMAASCIVVVALTARMKVVDAEGHPVHLLPRIAGFWLWLIGRVIVSNLQVARLILDPRRHVAPRVLRFTATQRDDLGRTIHANCVTLTPGTVTLEVRDDALLVHTLDPDDSTEPSAIEMDRRVSAAAGGRT